MATSGRKFGLSTWIVLALALPVAYMTMNLFRKWHAIGQQLDKSQGEFQTLSTRNAELAQAFDVLQNKKFQICNKSPDPLRVSWLAAAYNDGKQLKLFDSARCGGWQEIEVAPGENKNLLLSSSQEGCNWSGNVMYFAMRLSKETEEASVPYNMAAIYRNFDRDCFTVQ